MDILSGCILQAGFEYFFKHFPCSLQMVIVISLLANCEGRSWRDISNTFIYLDLSVQITHDSLVIIKFPQTFSHIYFILS